MNLPMNTLGRRCLLALTLSMLCAGAARAQVYSEDFTGRNNSNDWYFYNGACLTAGTSTSNTEPGPIPGCAHLAPIYYTAHGDNALVGGSQGYLGSSTYPSTASAVVPDPVGGGALRFTNGYPGGYSQSGAIVSATPFPITQGIEITFKSVTYLGNKDGSGGDGADGMSFYLMDGSQSPGIGAFGGSLAYTCSNANSPFDGLVGGYLGLGIDEYGNFLNGSVNTLGETGTGVSGDNTASGGGYRWNRIGLRGAGSVAWSALTGAYGTNPGSNTLPYYPASLHTTCSNGGVYNAGSNSCGPVCTVGTYNSSANTCDICSVGTFYQPTNKCNSCSVGTYNPGTGTCTPVATCPAGSAYNAGTNSCVPQCTVGSYNGGTGVCDVCPVSNIFDLTHGTSAKPCAKCTIGVGIYNSATGTCSIGSVTWRTPASTSAKNTPTPTLVTSAPTTASPLTGSPYYLSAVQKTCSSGNLWNYSNPNSPTNAGPASLSNAGNTQGILDYTAIPGAYSVLNGIQIANETATTRPQATPIFYDLKITQDGLLTFSYSISGAAYQTVIKNQSITASNGPLPASFRFGFGGSTGGGTNVHEIMCFKAVPSSESGGSTSVNEKQSAQITSLTQAYFGYYNPTPTVWTGDLTANYLIDTAGVVSVNQTANWSGSCVLSGVNTGFGTLPICPKTGSSAAATAEAPSSRVMMTWNGTTGVPFQWADLSVAQQNTLDFGDTPPFNGKRLAYLRGDRTNEIGNSAGAGLFRARDGVLSDIVDASPQWVGPPNSSYTANWVDRLYPAASAPENATANSYLAYVNAQQTRLNVVYVGANDGFMHGFRSGSFDVNGNYVNNALTPNDGQEVLAYMPAGVLQSASDFYDNNPTQTVVEQIHGVTPGNAAALPPTVTGVTSGLDLTGTQYGHNFFVDATPGTGDLYFAGAWHTWLVSGLGPGGADIFALDITNPASFSESSAATTVIGDWNPSTITCIGNATCGMSLGNTFGTPLIHRFHNGDWGAVFGNGFGSQNGDAGIYVMMIDHTSGTPAFYYISAGHAGGNGIAFVAAADLDGDHITDYVYAGDLQGHVWRFDLTSNMPSNWSAGSTPLFTTPAGQPITSAVIVSAIPVPGGAPRVLVSFGTGQRTQLTNLTPTTYASGTQALYGVWDWNLGSWNSKASTQYQSLATGPASLGIGNLTAQTLTYVAATQTYDASNTAICWDGLTLCGSGNTQFGWYVNLQGGSEQIIYNPTLFNGAFIVDSVVPANNIPTQCATNLDTGFTYAVSVATGGAISPIVQGLLTSAFPQYSDVMTAGVQTNATGTPYIVNTAEGQMNLVYQTISGQPCNGGNCTQFTPGTNTKANRMTWLELR